ncbi:MAG TPA: DUF533 domain-containing protein [Hyphomonadaceae bacterium]|nr:DUF533 domain-containing protein [Hyphomonadaceae bacterium]
MFDANKLLNQMLGADGAKQAQGAMGQVGGLLGSLLQQSVSGMQEGAAAIEKQTGLGAGADNLIKQVSGGKSAGDLFNQAKTMAGQNKMATGVGIGALGALLLGTGGGRSLVGTAATLGGLALVGGLAYKAYTNHQAGKAPPQSGAPQQIEAAPDASPYGETGNPQQDNETSMLILRAMIAAAACDGVVDNEERSRIVGGLQQAGLDVHAAKFLDDEFARPATIAELVAAAKTDALKAQAYTAARVAIDPDTMKEKAFLMNLAVALGLDEGLVAQIDAGAAAAKAPPA